MNLPQDQDWLIAIFPTPAPLAGSMTWLAQSDTSVPWNGVAPTDCDSLAL